MHAALEVADIFRRHGDAFRTAQRGRLLPDQRRVMAAIEACRTATLGGHVEQCDDCGMVRIAYNSCRDRHCPKCQGLARAQWLADRQADLLPVPYFHVVFTVPAPIAAIALQNKAIVYDILLKTAAETIRVISADPQHPEPSLSWTLANFRCSGSRDIAAISDAGRIFTRSRVCPGPCENSHLPHIPGHSAHPSLQKLAKVQLRRDAPRLLGRCIGAPIIDAADRDDPGRLLE